MERENKMAVPAYTLNKNIKFTYKDYLICPSNGKQLQLLEGELYMTPAPKTFHQDIALNIAEILRNFTREDIPGKVYIAPTDVVLSDNNVVQPDILFISKEKLHIITKDNIKGAPDLIVEILSEKTKKLDVEIKRRQYAHFGVKEYWIVDPDKKTVEVLALSDAGYVRAGLYKRNHTLSSPLLRGLKIKTTEIFKK